MFIDMIDYLLEIGTRKGAYVPVSGRDVADARRNGKAWLSVTCPVCAASYRQNARCRLDGGLDQCYGDGCPVRIIDPTQPWYRPGPRRDRVLMSRPPSKVGRMIRRPMGRSAVG
jgi:hypothetical protein